MAVLMRTYLGETLRELRRAEGLTLRELSSASLVSLGYLSEIERGRKEPSSEVLASISAALGVPQSTLLGLVADKMSLLEARPAASEVVLAA